MYLCMSDSSLVALLLLRVTPYRHTPEILWVHFQTPQAMRTSGFPSYVYTHCSLLIVR